MSKRKNRSKTAGREKAAQPGKDSAAQPGKDKEVQPGKGKAVHSGKKGDSQPKGRSAGRGKKASAFPGRKVWPVIAAVAVLAAVIVGVTHWRRSKQPEEAVLKDYDAAECVTLGKYSGISVSLAVGEDEVQDEIDSVLEDNAAYEQLAGVTQTGQTVYADFEGYVNGKRAEDTCGSDYVELGSGEWLDGFEESLTGVNTGDTVNFTVAVPEGTYGSDAIDGKNVDFTATVQYICGEEILPEYTDEFVQSISDEYTTTDEYTEHIREDLRKENEEQKAEYAWSDVVDAAKVKKYPDSLLEYAKKEVLQGYYDMAYLYDVSREEIFPQFGYESEQAFVDTDLKPLAKDTAKEYLVSEAIAEKEGISYTQEQYEKLLKDEYSGMTDEYDTIEAYEAEMKEYLERQALMEQVKLWISDHTDYTE